jgi:hypothetical protein
MWFLRKEHHENTLRTLLSLSLSFCLSLCLCLSLFMKGKAEEQCLLGDDIKQSWTGVTQGARCLTWEDKSLQVSAGLNLHRSKLWLSWWERMACQVSVHEAPVGINTVGDGPEDGLTHLRPSRWRCSYLFFSSFIPLKFFILVLKFRHLNFLGLGRHGGQCSWPVGVLPPLWSEDYL